MGFWYVFRRGSEGYAIKVLLFFPEADASKGWERYQVQTYLIMKVLGKNTWGNERDQKVICETSLSFRLLYHQEKLSKSALVCTIRLANNVREKGTFQFQRQHTPFTLHWKQTPQLLSLPASASWLRPPAPVPWTWCATPASSTWRSTRSAGWGPSPSRAGRSTARGCPTPRAWPPGRARCSRGTPRPESRRCTSGPVA